MLTPDQLQQIQARCESKDIRAWEDIVEHAREDLTALIAEVERQRAESLKWAGTYGRIMAENSLLQEQNERLRAENERMAEALKKADRWLDGWCPNATCCARTGKEVHEEIRKALAAKGQA